MRILVVEDYAPVRESVVQALEEAGFAVDETLRQRSVLGRGTSDHSHHDQHHGRRTHEVLPERGIGQFDHGVAVGA